MWKQKATAIMIVQRAERAQREREQRIEMAKMTCDHRTLVRNRTEFELRLKPVLMKQERWTQQLEDEAADCELDLKVAASGYYMRQDREDIKRLKRHISEYEHYKAKCKRLREEMELLNKDLKVVSHELYVTNKRIMERMHECRVMCRVPRPDIVARRLEIICTEFGEQLQQNRQLIDEIHHLIIEREKHSKVTASLEAEIKKLSKTLMDHVEVASDSYNKLDTIKRGVHKLQEHFNKNINSFEMEMNNFNSGIDVLKRTERFMTMKNKQRPDEDRERRRLLREKLTETEKENLMYSSVVQQIRSRLGDEELNEIIMTFLELVDENYMLFRNVAEVRDHVNELQTEIENVRAEISKRHSLTLRQEQESTLLRQELTEKRDICKNVAESVERAKERAENTIQAYIDGILFILGKLGYTEDEIKQLAGAMGQVDHRNVFTFLGEIERYINKLWLIQDYVGYHTWTRRPSFTTADPVPQHPLRTRPAPRMSVVLPFLRPEDSEDNLSVESGVRPLSLQELLQSVEDELDASAHDIEDPTQPPESEDAMLSDSESTQLRSSIDEGTSHTNLPTKSNDVF